MANVQKENGYTPIAHELLEEIPKYKFNGTQFKIIMIVWRYTYGFHRKSHDFSLSFLAEATGSDKSTIKKQLNSLINNKVLAVVEEATFNKPRKLAFNKEYPEWEIQKSTQGDKSTEGAKSHPPTGGQNTPSEGAKRPPLQGAVSPPKIYIFKNNFKDITTTIRARKFKSRSEVKMEPHVAILNRYRELKGAIQFTPKDEMAAKEIEREGIPLEDALKYLEDCFKDYEQKRRHSRDNINALDYCVGYIFDRYYEKKEEGSNVTRIHGFRSSNGKGAGKGKSYEQALREAELANRTLGRRM